ncbi:hypothetical protein GGR58DRAFT_455387 [Xylaria digitata]|nr:hypothetical protein GGR58DRAFT_455387 [Xylaria digitata]
MEEHDNLYDDAHSLAVRGSDNTRPGCLGARQIRKSHTKSRNGCQHCKRRRIKCDEAKPICHNCLRLSIPCSYIPLGSQPETTEIVPEVVRKRGRPRKNWTVVSVGSDNTSVTSSLASLNRQLEKPQHIPWDAQDLELFFHYINEVCDGLEAGDSSLWKDRVPRLSFRCHGLLHLLLAISALHLARQDPNRRHGLEERAEMHLAIGIRRSTEILPNLSTENCAELYISTILACICGFAKRPGPRNLLLVADGSEVAWWELFRGVRVVVDFIGIPTVFSGELGPPPSHATEDHQGDSSHDHHHVDLNFVDWEDALGRLSALVSSAPDLSVRDTCQGALGVMACCFQETYGTTACPKPRVDVKFNTIMAWPYCLSDEFIGHLKNKEPVPLILLAHFTVLVQTFDSIWFMKGWASHVLQGVSETLGPALCQWIWWPTVQLERAGMVVTPSVLTTDTESSLTQYVTIPMQGLDKP